MQAAIDWVPTRIVSDNIPHTAMIHHIKEESDRFAEVHMTRQEIRQLIRCYLLLLFHDYFYAHGGDNLRLWWLPYLRYFDQTYTVAWGGYVLVLYESMDLICRHMELNHRGLTTLWEVYYLLSF